MKQKHRVASCIVALLASISVHAGEIIVRQPPQFEGGIPQDCRQPAYPVEALRYELEGESIVELLIDASGKVADKRVSKSSGWKLLDESVLQTMASCRFTPMTHDGKPVGSQWKKFSYVWTLRDPGESNRTTLPILIPQSCSTSNLFALTDNPLNTNGGLMRFLVSPEGSAFGIKIERGSSDPATNDAAVAALQRCKFQPTIRNGLAVPGNGFATYKFAKTQPNIAPTTSPDASVILSANGDGAITLAESCKTREAALAMMKTVQAESAAARTESALATEAFRIQMNEKGATLGWDENKKSAVFRELKSTEKFILLETEINKMRQDMLDLNKTVNVSNFQADPAGTCIQIQSVRTLIRQIDSKSKELRRVKQSYLAAIKS